MIAVDRRIAIAFVAVLVAALAALAVATPPPARAQTPPPADSVHLAGFLNAYRTERVRLPDHLQLDTGWSESCRLHNIYSRLNSSLAHGEIEGFPGYTKEGNWVARLSVLYWNTNWTYESNPFETAPFHLHQLLNPRLDRVGASENDNFGCMTSLASRNRPAPRGLETYTYPRDGALHRPSEVAVEGPYTPGSRVGIPEGTRTGPYLYFMFDGPWNAAWSTSKVNSASVTGPNGPVEVKVVDQQTPDAGRYLPIGAEVIPVQPLAPNARYTVNLTATVTDPYSNQQNGKYVPKNYDVNHSFSFSTNGGRGEIATSVRQDPTQPLQETDVPAPETQRAYKPPIPEILKAKVRGANVHVTADVGEVGELTATLLNRRHKGKGQWKSIDVRKKSKGEVKLVGRIPVGVSFVRVDSSDLEHFQPEVDYGPKDNPDGHSDVLGPGEEPSGEEDGSTLRLVRTK